MSAAPTEAFQLLDAGTAEQGRRFHAEIPSSSPLFEGHFPGRPILPGIAHLALVERAVGSLAGVRALRLRRPVNPGSVLALTIRDAEEAGWVRFELRRGEELVSGGAVHTGPVAFQEREPLEMAVPTGTDFPSVDWLIPHAPPSRFIRNILAASAEEIVCAAEFSPRHPLVKGDEVPAFAGIEAAAQAAAALEALNRRKEAPGPRLGYLVGVREARFAAFFLAAGRPQRVTARLKGVAFPLSVYEITVGDPGRPTVTGTISTFAAGPSLGDALVSTRDG